MEMEREPYNTYGTLSLSPLVYENEAMQFHFDKLPSDSKDFFHCDISIGLEYPERSALQPICVHFDGSDSTNESERVDENVELLDISSKRLPVDLGFNGLDKTSVLTNGNYTTIQSLGNTVSITEIPAESNDYPNTLCNDFYSRPDYSDHALPVDSEKNCINHSFNLNHYNQPHDNYNHQSHSHIFHRNHHQIHVNSHHPTYHHIHHPNLSPKQSTFNYNNHYQQQKKQLQLHRYRHRKLTTQRASPSPLKPNHKHKQRQQLQSTPQPRSQAKPQPQLKSQSQLKTSPQSKSQPQLKPQKQPTSQKETQPSPKRRQQRNHVKTLEEKSQLNHRIVKKPRQRRPRKYDYSPPKPTKFRSNRLRLKLQSENMESDPDPEAVADPAEQSVSKVKKEKEQEVLPVDWVRPDDLSFDRHNVSEFEKASLPEFFAGKYDRTHFHPSQYLQIRNIFLDEWESRKPNIVRFREMIRIHKGVGNVVSFSRVCKFLTAIGAINDVSQDDTIVTGNKEDDDSVYQSLPSVEDSQSKVHDEESEEPKDSPQPPTPSSPPSPSPPSLSSSVRTNGLSPPATPSEDNAPQKVTPRLRRGRKRKSYFLNEMTRLGIDPLHAGFPIPKVEKDKDNVQQTMNDDRSNELENLPESVHTSLQ